VDLGKDQTVTEKREGRYVKFKTRQRVTVDGGKSRLAAEAQF
jgi:hypothetical protein